MRKALIVIGWIGLVSFCLSMIVICYRGYQFTRACGSYLRLAADAPNVERANEFLSSAIGYIEKHGLISGNSALIFKTPKTDMSIWYKQTLGALETTKEILAKGDKASQLERDNALMKIREVVIEGEGVVTLPPHISLYPQQWAIYLWLIMSLIGICFLFAYAMDDYS